MRKLFVYIFALTVAMTLFSGAISVDDSKAATLYHWEGNGNLNVFNVSIDNTEPSAGETVRIDLTFEATEGSIFVENLVLGDTLEPNLLVMPGEDEEYSFDYTVTGADINAKQVTFTFNWVENAENKSGTLTIPIKL
ncbi:MAG TPA: hypothetical protein PLZ84_03505, partial [Clostridia bacterium]|nr:hypothetical protein [Clostridia bacterium]